MVVIDHLVHKYDEILCSVHHGGRPASHHGPPVGEGHGGVSPKIQGLVEILVFSTSFYDSLYSIYAARDFCVAVKNPPLASYGGL